MQLGVGTTKTAEDPGTWVSELWWQRVGEPKPMVFWEARALANGRSSGESTPYEFHPKY